MSQHSLRWRATNNQTNPHSSKILYWIYSDFACHLKLLDLNLRQSIVDGRVERPKDWRLLTVHLQILTNMFPAVTVTVVRNRKIRTALRTNQIAGFVTMPSLENKIVYFHCYGAWQNQQKYKKQSPFKKKIIASTTTYRSVLNCGT